jgi:hypothetical protein
MSRKFKVWFAICKTGKSANWQRKPTRLVSLFFSSHKPKKDLTSYLMQFSGSLPLIFFVHKIIPEHVVHHYLLKNILKGLSSEILIPLFDILA